MINQEILNNITKGVTMHPCPYCGEHHEFRMKLAHSSAQSSAVISEASFDLGRSVVSYDFDEGACEPFRKRAIAFAEEQINRLM